MTGWDGGGGGGGGWGCPVAAWYPEGGGIG